MELAPSKAVSLNGKAFRPLLCWFIVSVALLAWRHHQEQERESNIQFSVSMEGRKERPSYGATLNELSYSAGQHSGLGRKELRIQAEGAEPFVTNLFVWYGGKNLGHIELARSRGTLDLKTTPAALRVEVSNQETNAVLFNSTGLVLSLPIGSYEVKARFARFGTERQVEIKAHQTSRVVIDPGITALRVDSQPTDAEFELSSVLPADITVLTNTPAILTDLRSGEYHLRIWRGDYEKIVPVTLRAGVDTNELKVEFDYARLTLHSEPAGATIREGEKILGTTPVSLTRPTGLIRLTVAKEGFASTNFELTLQAKEERTVDLTLLNRAYVTALEQARENSTGFSPDFRRALEEVNRALQNKSGDAAALALRQSIMFQVHLRDARDFQRQGEIPQALSQVELALQINASDAGALDLKRALEREPEKPKRKSRAVPAPPAAAAKPPAESIPVPPVAEVPQQAIAEKTAATVAPEPKPETLREPAAPRDLGRGGEQHRAIQERLQSAAHTLGFLAQVESQLTKESNHAADLVLQRGPICLAVEITITTTTDHEFGNVKKCLAAGFTRVAMVSPKPESLQAIAQAVQAGLGPEAAAQVSYHSPDDLIAELRKLGAGPVEEAKPSLPKVRTTRGYDVRRHAPVLSASERKSKEAIADKILLETIKPKV